MKKLTKKVISQSEKQKFNRFKRECKHAIATLTDFHQSLNITHCVLVIGQPESGKSTLCASLEKSLLTLSQDEIQNEFSFEIYQQHTSLFFQIPQDLFLFSDLQLQRQAWHFLASRLKQQRPYIIITDCLVTIDLYDFLTRSKVSNDTRLSQIGLGLNTLANKLKIPLNVALFLTKADLIPGFNEFFDHENKEFLEQAWGASLQSTEIFTEECQLLVKKLNERLLWRLHHEINPEYLFSIKNFPLVMETIKQKFAEVLPAFLIQWTHNKFLNPTRLYFVSCRQYKELQDATHANSLKKKEHSKESHKNFFVKHALNTLCEPPALRSNFYLEKFTRVIFITLCSLILLAFIFYTSQQFSRHIELARAATQILSRENSFVKKPYASLKLNDVTSELDKINFTLAALNKDQQSLFVGKYIFSGDKDLELRLNSLSQHIATQQWLPLINQRLEGFIHQNLSSAPERAYIAFKIYLMLSQTDWAIDTNYINTHLPYLFDSSDSKIISLPAGIQKKVLVDDENSPFIRDCRNSFLALPTSKLAYILLFSNVDRQNSLNLSNTISNNPSSLEIERKYAVIPEIYTKNLFTITYAQRLQAVAEEANNGNSVLGPRQKQDASADTLLPQLQKEYVQLYSNAWEEAINHTHLTPTSTLQDFSIQLAALASVDSPILALLKASQMNTDIPTIENSSAFLQEFNKILTAQSTPENNALFHSFSFLKKLSVQLQTLEKSDHLKTGTCDLLKQEYAATEQNPTDAQQLRYLATQLPEPVKTWLSQLVENYYALLNQDAAGCQ